MKGLDGKKVLVTGAASGIGRGAALAFGRKGSKLILVDVDARRLAKTESSLRDMGVECRAYCTDVSSASQVAELRRRVEADLDGIDVLVNVAGVAVGADIVDTTLDDWNRVLGVNLWGPIHTISEFLPRMIENRQGHIVNVASAGGFFAGAGLGAYCTSKFGLVGLTEALFQEVREHNIGVTAMCPGITNTPILDRVETRNMSHQKVMKQARFVLSHSVSTEKTGEMIVRAVELEKPIVVTTMLARLVYYLKRVSPRAFRLLAHLARRYQNEFLR